MTLESGKSDPAVVAPLDDATGRPRASSSSFADLEAEITRLSSELDDAKASNDRLQKANDLLDDQLKVPDPDATLAMHLSRELNPECGCAVCAVFREYLDEALAVGFSFDDVAAELARLRSTLQITEQERDALKPADITADECSFAVLSVRMARQGFSYDAKAGIWWKDDAKPGVLEAAEAKLTALLTARDRLVAEMREVVRDAGGSVSKLTVAHYADRLASLGDGGRGQEQDERAER